MLYLLKGGTTSLTLAEGTYRVQRYDPRAGKLAKLSDASGTKWNSPAMPNSEDWVVLLERR